MSRRGGPARGRRGEDAGRGRLPLAGLRVGFLAQNEVEELHLWVPWYRLREEGAACCVIGNDEPRTYRGAHGLEIRVDEASWRTDPAELAGIVIPGGYGADLIRQTPDTRGKVRYADLLGRVVAAIERGVWVLVSAGIVRGRTLAAPAHLWDDLLAAGARMADVEVVVDGNLVTARDTEALPGFCPALVAALAKVASAPPRHHR